MYKLTLLYLLSFSIGYGALEDLKEERSWIMGHQEDREVQYAHSIYIDDFNGTFDENDPPQFNFNSLSREQRLCFMTLVLTHNLKELRNCFSLEDGDPLPSSDEAKDREAFHEDGGCLYGMFDKGEEVGGYESSTPVYFKFGSLKGLLSPLIPFKEDIQLFYQGTFLGESIEDLVNLFRVYPLGLEHAMNALRDSVPIRGNEAIIASYGWNRRQVNALNRLSLLFELKAACFLARGEAFPLYDYLKSKTLREFVDLVFAP